MTGGERKVHFTSKLMIVGESEEKKFEKKTMRITKREMILNKQKWRSKICSRILTLCVKGGGDGLGPCERAVHLFQRLGFQNKENVFLKISNKKL